MPDDIDNAPGFYRLELGPESAERLVLRFPEADVTASPADGPHILVELELRGNRGSVPAWNPSIRRIEGILVVGEEGGAVTVTELRVRVPSAIRDLEIHNKNGDIEVRGLPIGLLVESQSGSVFVAGAASFEARTVDGEIVTEATGLSELVTASGKIKAVKPEGRFNARSDSGDVEIEDSAADLYLETSSGEITITRPRGRIRVSSQSGDIEIEAPELFGGGEATTTSGHIGLFLSGTSVELRAETLSGRLRTPQGEVGNSAGPRRAALSVAGGGRRLHAKSVSGDIEIEF